MAPDEYGYRCFKRKNDITKNRLENLYIDRWELRRRLYVVEQQIAVLEYDIGEDYNGMRDMRSKN
jgi:hypothetical protein